MRLILASVLSLSIFISPRLKTTKIPIGSNANHDDHLLSHLFVLYVGPERTAATPLHTTRRLSPTLNPPRALPLEPTLSSIPVSSSSPLHTKTHRSSGTC